MIVVCMVFMQTVYPQTVSWQQQPCWDAVELFGDNLLKVEQMNQWGLVDFDGTTILPCKYAKITKLSEDRFLILDDNDRLLSLGDSSGKIVQVDGNWNVDETWPCFTNGLLAVKNTQGLWGYMNKLGKIVIKERFKNAFPFFFGYASVCEKGTKSWHLIDVKGRPIDLVNGKQRQKNFSFASSFTKIDDNVPLAFVLVSDSLFFIDNRGDVNDNIVSKKGVSFSGLENENLFKCIDANGFVEIEVNNLLEIISIKDEISHSCHISSDNAVSNPKVQGVNCEKDGTIKVGSLVISPQFQEVIPINVERMLVKKNKKWGLLAFNKESSPARILFNEVSDETIYHAIPLSFQIKGGSDNMRAYSIDETNNITFWNINVETGAFHIPMTQLNDNKGTSVTVGLETDGIMLAPAVFTTKMSLGDGFNVTGPKAVVSKNGQATFELTINNQTEQDAMAFDVVVNDDLEMHYDGLKAQQSISIPVEMSVKIPVLEDYVYKPIRVKITENGMPERTYKITIKFAKAYIKG